jgi:hypothetical protein
MEINGINDQVRIHCTLEELRTIYLALRRGVDMESDESTDALMDVQTYLHAEARRQGIDPQNHAEWERFLGIPEEEVRGCPKQENPTWMKD